MRSGLLSAIFLGILVLGGFSLVLTDWNGMFHGVGASKTDVAKVDGHPIKASEFNALLERQLRTSGIGVDMAYKSGFVDQVLQSEVVSRLMKRAAKDFGIEVDDSFVAQQILSLVEPLVNKDVNKKQALRQFVQMQGMSEAQLVTLVRDEIEKNLVRGTLMSANYVPNDLLADILSYKGLSRSGEFITLKSEDIRLPKIPDEKILRDYYRTIENQYLTTETRDATVAILNLSDMASGQNKGADTSPVSLEEIKNYYDSNIHEFEVPEMRGLEQSITQSESEAIKIADSAKKNHDLRKSVVEVTGSETAFSPVANFKKDELSDELGTPIFLAKIGEVIGPLKSPLGFHVFKMVDVSPAHTQTLEDVKSKIATNLQSEKAQNEIYTITAAIEDRLAGGESYASIAKDYPSLSINKLSGISATDKLSEKIKDRDQALPDAAGVMIARRIFQQSQGEVGSLMDLPPHSFFSVTVDHVELAKPKQFSEVQKEIEKKWVFDQKSQENLSLAEDLVAQLNKGTLTLKEVAKDKGLQLQQFANLSRQTDVAETSEAEQSSVKSRDDTIGGKNLSPYLMEPSVRDRYMNVKQGQYVAAFSQDRKIIVLGCVTKTVLGERETSHKNSEASSSKLTEQELTALKNLQDMTAMSNSDLLINKLERKYPVEINRSLLERIYAPKETQNKVDN